MILVIDNYDSFTYNLVHLLEGFDEVKVFRNDKLSPNDIAIMAPDKIVISPGPGRPADAGISKKIIEEFKDKIDILGVCLGHQCIGEVFASKVVEAKHLVHGKAFELKQLQDDSLFTALENNFLATRYHSLIVDRESLGSELEVLAESEDGEIMALRHRKHNVYGVQFHPESILTENGKKLLANFIEI